MGTFTVLLLQLSIPLLAGFAVSSYLRRPTNRLLIDLCGTSERADFWVRITTVFLLTGPLTLVLLFGSVPTECQQDPGSCFTNTIKQSMSLSLIGILVGVLVVAQAIWRQVPRRIAAA